MLHTTYKQTHFLDLDKSWQIWQGFALQANHDLLISYRHFSFVSMVIEQIWEEAL